MAAMDYNTAYSTNYTNKYAVFVPTWTNVNGKDEIISLEKINEDRKSGVQNINARYNNRITALFAHFDYNRVFGQHTMILVMYSSRP